MICAFKNFKVEKLSDEASDEFFDEMESLDHYAVAVDFSGTIKFNFEDISYDFTVRGLLSQNPVAGNYDIAFADVSNEGRNNKLIEQFKASMHYDADDVEEELKEEFSRALFELAVKQNEHPYTEFLLGESVPNILSKMEFGELEFHELPKVGRKAIVPISYEGEQYYIDYDATPTGSVFFVSEPPIQPHHPLFKKFDLKYMHRAPLIVWYEDLLRRTIQEKYLQIESA